VIRKFVKKLLVPKSEWQKRKDRYFLECICLKEANWIYSTNDQREMDNYWKNYGIIDNPNWYNFSNDGERIYQLSFD